MTAVPRARVLTEPLGGSPLSLAIQTRGLPSALQPWSPATSDEWRTHAERRRASASGWFERLREALAPFGTAAERLERVAGGNGVVVTTGQQPGLFGGPLYTMAKALTALELADAIERDTGVPAAPVFWAATDDADFAEASLAALADAEGLKEARQSPAPPPGTPMSAAPLGAVAPLVDMLRSACGSAPHPRYFELARAAYTRETTTGAAYVRLLRGLLEPLGMAVLDASHDAYRKAAHPLLSRALSSADAIAATSAERAAALRELGFDPQVEDDRGLSLVFAMEKGIKRRVTVAEAKVFAARQDLVLSPNVLLRPVVERELLPTVAYVAGPGELAYFTQSDAVARALDLDRLSCVPRWSGIVIEPAVDRALQRLGLQYQELKELHAVEKRLARKALPEKIARAWKQLGSEIQSAIQELDDAVRDDRLLPPTVVQGLSHSIGHRLHRTERRLLAAAKRRDDVTRRDLAMAAAALWPWGQRQERILNFIPMLSLWGDALLDDLRGAARGHVRQLVGARRQEPAHAR